MQSNIIDYVLITCLMETSFLRLRERQMAPALPQPRQWLKMSAAVETGTGPHSMGMGPDGGRTSTVTP